MGHGPFAILVIFLFQMSGALPDVNLLIPFQQPMNEQALLQDLGKTVDRMAEILNEENIKM